MAVDFPFHELGQGVQLDSFALLPALQEIPCTLPWAKRGPAACSFPAQLSAALPTDLYVHLHGYGPGKGCIAKWSVAAVQDVADSCACAMPRPFDLQCSNALAVVQCPFDLLPGVVSISVMAPCVDSIYLSADSDQTSACTLLPSVLAFPDKGAVLHICRGASSAQKCQKLSVWR